MTQSLAESFAYCRKVARRRAKNFYYSFVLLGRAEHDAMCAVYAFMRYCDDLSDDPASGSDANALLGRWRSDLEAALAGAPTNYPLWPAFSWTVDRYRIPHQYFHEMIDGVSSDLAPRVFLTFDELYRYCHQVASVVGLTVIHIMGFDSTAAPALAEKCGVAFQLTNILRDIREDAGRGRVYLPADDLGKFGVSCEDLLGGRGGDAFRELLRFEAGRAKTLYEESSPLIGMVNRRNRRALWALIEIYRRLLGKIARSNYEVLRGRISLSVLEKCQVVAQAAVRPITVDRDKRA